MRFIGVVHDCPAPTSWWTSLVGLRLLIAAQLVADQGLGDQ